MFVQSQTLYNDFIAKEGSQYLNVLNLYSGKKKTSSVISRILLRTGEKKV